MYIEPVYLITLIFICLFAGFKLGTFLEARYWEAYIEFNKDSEIGMLKHIISHKDIKINELVKEVEKWKKEAMWRMNNVRTALNKIRDMQVDEDDLEKNIYRSETILADEDEGAIFMKGDKENGDSNEM